MRHLVVSREFPPAAYPAGGIGTYASHIARLLAERGEEVHVIGQLWAGAPKAVEALVGGRLTIHRVPLDWPPAAEGRLASPDALVAVRDFLAQGRPALAFAWQAALLAEDLVERAFIDVIEGQDYESPLYFLQLRRALGIGPTRQPPCLVHLHSPLEFICRYNDWAIGRPERLVSKRCEDYSIAAADGWLCPSHFLATQAEAHYGLGSGAIARIPLPTGETRPIDRTREVWQRGTICYVGRMETRKGVFEWVDAAVAVASDVADARFVFIGSDTSVDGEGGMSTRHALAARIPASLAGRFSFLEALPRDRLFQRLAEARIAVVPSRWENFPNTCIEAMGSGVPVLATRNGGMSEVIEDGRSGWLAAACSPVELAATLRRALATPPADLAAMGARAVSRVAQHCDNGRVVDAHVVLRARIAAAGVVRSHLLADTLPFAPPLLLSGPRAGSGITERPAVPRIVAAAVATAGGKPGSVAAIVDARHTPAASAAACIASLRAQTRRPSRIAVVGDAARLEALKTHTDTGAGDVVLVPSAGPSGGARARALDAILANDMPAAVACVDGGCLVRPDLLDRALVAFDRVSRAGVLMPWIITPRRPGTFDGPCPALPYSWLTDEAGALTVWRTVALCDAGGFPRDFDAGLDLWDALLGVMARGWAAATLPAVAGLHRGGDQTLQQVMAAAARVRLWPWILTRNADHLDTYATDLAVLLSARADARAVGEGAAASGLHVHFELEAFVRTARRLSGPLRLAWQAIVHPRYTARWVAAHGRSIVRRPSGEPEYSGRKSL